jgi:hypothetical protein
MSNLNYEGGLFETNNYGALIITKYVNASEVHVKFIETGYETDVEMVQIKNGNVKDRWASSVCGVGLIGNEPTYANGKHLKEYMLWGAMLKRCYDDKYHSKHPTYKDCYVSENFKYYPYFKSWCFKQVGFDQIGWELDKDVFVKGNRVYSEDTCVFIPQEINKLLNKHDKARGEYPIGVGYDKKNNKFESRLSIHGKQIRLGRFNTAEEAFQAYKHAKEDQIKIVANKWKEQIDTRVYEALMGYQVESQINSRNISPLTGVIER